MEISPRTRSDSLILTCMTFSSSILLATPSLRSVRKATSPSLAKASSATFFLLVVASIVVWWEPCHDLPLSTDSSQSSPTNQCRLCSNRSTSSTALAWTLQVALCSPIARAQVPSP
uniref:Uncharacterized protein n=1 Tax=uncultured marine group II/III euryarchaeote AD1000_96_B04 TaxID=1457829 RepID=A0A075G138_9EURY|nr:hypothetical protein [uncultured marine group II/III euryarchaeote AD1000_96_B04]